MGGVFRSLSPVAELLPCHELTVCFILPTLMSQSMLAGKLGVVFGVANKRSIAWAIAQAWHVRCCIDVMFVYIY